MAATDGQPASAGQLVRDVLECHVGRALVGIARAHVGQVVEYPLVPVPLPARYVGGVGLWQERVLVSIALSPVAGARARSTRGVLLSIPDAAPDAPGWVLEVGSVGGFVPVTLLGGSERAPGDKVPPWMVRARTPDGKVMAWLDVPRMVRELAAGEPVA
jgi:hypothetical protein